MKSIKWICRKDVARMICEAGLFNANVKHVENNENKWGIGLAAGVRRDVNRRVVLYNEQKVIAALRLRGLLPSAGTVVPAITT